MVTNELHNVILDADQDFHKNTGMFLIKSEAKIIMLIKKNGPMSIKEVMSFLNVSYRGFYIIINRMIEKELIFLQSDTVDRRVKRINLNPEIF